MTALVPLPTDTDLELAADPGQFVVLACERAKSWLAQALEHGEIDQIVELKSQAEAIRVYTTQKQLGKDAELSAAEIVRRAERGLGIAIKRGQHEGTVRRKGEGGGPSSPSRDTTKTSPTPAFAHPEERRDSYALADADDNTFEEAIEEAKAEGNVSRANVVRKVKGDREPITNPYQRKYKRAHGDELVERAITSLSGIASALKDVNPGELSDGCVGKFAQELGRVLRELRTFHKGLVELNEEGNSR